MLVGADDLEGDDGLRVEAFHLQGAEVSPCVKAHSIDPWLQRAGLQQVGDAAILVDDAAGAQGLAASSSKQS